MAAITTVTSPFFESYQLRPYNPNALYQKAGSYSILSEMLEDDQISAVMRFRNLLVVGKGVRVECEDDSVREFCEWALEHINIKERLYEIMTGDGYGFSLSEKVATVVRDSPFPQNVVIRIKTRPPNAWKIIQDDYGDIEEYIYEDRGPTSVPTGLVLHYINNAEFDVPYGNPDLNMGVYRAWWLKKNIIKFWGIFLERYATPKPIGKYPEGYAADSQEITDFRAALKSFAATTAMSMPKDFDVTFLEAGSSDTGAVFERAIDKCNMMISRDLLFPDLTGMGGAETGGGSYALGTFQGKLLLMALRSKAERLERLITNDYLPQLIQLNFGRSVEAKFCLEGLSDEENIEKVKAFIEAVSKGAAKVDLQDENRIRQVYGFDPVDEKEREERDAKAAEIAASMPAEKPEDGGAEEEDEEAEPEPEEEAKEYASLTPSERRLQEYFDTTEQAMKRQLSETVMDSARGLASMIRKRKIIENRKLSSVPALEFRGRGRLATVLRSSLMPVVKSGFADARDEMPKNYDAFTVEIDPAEYVSALSTSISASLSEEILKRIRLILMQGITNGDGVTQIMGQIESMLAEYDVKVPVTSEKGQISAPKLESIVRTNITKAYNEGRMSFFEKQARFIHAFRFSAILDGRNTARCGSLHGRIIRKSEARKYMPPLHHNCRSFLTAISIAEDELPEFDDMTDVAETPEGYFK